MINKPFIDYILQKEKEGKKYFESSEFKNFPELGVGKAVIYIYSLEKEFVTYPNGKGNIIYIGEACRRTEATGKRFSQHISTEEFVGGNQGTVYSLSRYYWLNKKIKLRVFSVPEANRAVLEKELLKIHVKKYGALPICQGTTGKNYKTTDIEGLILDEDLALLIDL